MGASQTGRYVPKVVADGQGGFFGFWEQFPNGYDEVVGQHILGNGQIAPGWPLDGLQVGGDDHEFYNLNSATRDGYGGALL